MKFPDIAKQAVPALLSLISAAAVSCSVNDLPGSDPQSINIQIGEYPVFQADDKTIGTPDDGKTAWSEADTILFVLQTAEDSLAARSNVVYTAGKWECKGAITLPSAPCRAVAFYAPTYESGESGEFLQWTSGESYNITDPSTAFKINFEKNYSRLRVASAKDFTISLVCADFVPAGYLTSKLGSGKTLECKTDANGNAFFYGKWPEGTSFSFNVYNTNGQYLFSEKFVPKSASVDGNSYAVSCILKFTDLTEQGVYSSTDNNPTAVRQYVEGIDQLSCTKSPSSRGWSIFSLQDGTYAKVTLPSTTLHEGATVQTEVCIDAVNETHNVSVVKMVNSQAWLEDKEKHTGYIITLL